MKRGRERKSVAGFGKECGERDCLYVCGLDLSRRWEPTGETEMLVCSEREEREMLVISNAKAVERTKKRASRDHQGVLCCTFAATDQPRKLLLPDQVSSWRSVSSLFATTGLAGAARRL